jgi:hypothetical protein
VRLKCHDDKEHIFEADTTLNIASDVCNIDGTDMVLVTEFFMPISMDGVDWSEVSSNFKMDWTRFLERKGEIEDNVVSRKDINRVQHTTAIALANGNFILISVRALDPSVAPIVFSNACVSFFDAANHMIAAGARSYIGTLAPVANSLARQLAISVFGRNESLVSLPLAIYSAQGDLCPDPVDRIYIHVGCHFDHIKPPSAAAAKGELARRIILSKKRLEEYVTRPDAIGIDTVREYVYFLASFGDHERDRG